MVPALNHDNISALGPIFLTAFFYISLSLAMGLIAR
jgi:hypothetical protein